jgi:Xaa-Pro aminopeptidase
MNHTTKIYNEMLKKGMDVAILVSRPNIRYASGFDEPFAAGWMQDVSNGLPMVTAVLSAQKKTIRLIASDLYKNKILRTGISDVEIYRSFTYLERNDADENYSRLLKEVLEEFRSGQEKTVIGIESNFAASILLQTAREALPQCVFLDVNQVLDECRRIKTLEDIRGLQGAARVADAAQQKLYEIARKETSCTELEIWFEVQKAASKAAGCLTPFVGELVTGARAGLSDYPLGPEDRKVEKGDIAIMDISPCVDGYWGDCSNSVVFWAEPNDEQKRYFYAVRDAFEVGLEAIRPGVRFCDVARIMEQEYRKHGLEVCSYQGHQIGCSVNEKPRFTFADDAVLEENMVVCIEPQAYTGKMGKTGVRLERMLHVTRNGAVMLNKFPWGIQ